MPLIIGLGHRREVGKTTVAEYIKRTRNYEHREFRTLVVGEMYDKAGFEIGPKPWSDRDRMFVQEWGRRKREGDPWYWADQMRAALNDLYACGRSVVVDGVRYPEEVAVLKSFGAVLVKVTLSPLTDKRVVTDADLHETETALEYYAGWDHEINAPLGQPELLYPQVDAIVGDSNGT